jgi:hypothetical protein
MKAVLDLTKSIKNKDFYSNQFTTRGTKKNILFVSPQLTSKHLYKFILPFFAFYNKEIHPAITDLSKFDPFKQIVDLSATLNQTEILWANYIVFPFTTQDLSKKYGLYEAIREINPLAKIVFCVDFNYYEIPKEHPYSELFTFDNIKEQVEKNVLMSDLVLVTNIALHRYLIGKFTELNNEKYKLNTKVTFGCVPYLIDEEIVLQNIEFESHKPEAVISKEIFKKIAEVAEEIKKEDLKSNKEKAIRVNSKKPAPKKLNTKTKKITGKKRGRKPKNQPKEEVIEQPIPVEEKETTTPITEQVANTEIKEPVVPVPPIQPVEIVKVALPKNYRIGIICSPTNYSDIKYFNDQFQLINDKFGDQVSLIFIGYDYDEDKEKILEGVNFEYLKQMSIIHYFKQLLNLKLDLVIVPTQKNIFNVTSENINKYLECSLIKIPLYANDIFPYNAIMVDKRNGFLYKEKTDFVDYLERILTNPDLMKVVAEQSKIDCMQNYTYNDINIKRMSDVYDLD